MKYVGKGVYNGSEFTFSGPINMFKISYGLDSHHNADAGFDQNLFDERPHTIDIDPANLKVDGVELESNL